MYSNYTNKENLQPRLSRHVFLKIHASYSDKSSLFLKIHASYSDMHINSDMHIISGMQKISDMHIFLKIYEYEYTNNVWLTF